MKSIKVKNSVTVVLNSGETITHNNCTDEMFAKVQKFVDAEDEDGVRSVLSPNYLAIIEKVTLQQQVLNGMSDSEYLTVKNGNLYIERISQLSIPEDLAIAIYKAEKSADLDLLATYMNFWTLASLNPDAQARVNLFWFLNRYGMSISKSGLFVAYRNVKVLTEGKQVDAKLVKFITDEFTRVRFKMKKSPKNYFIGYDESKNLVTTKSEADLSESLGTLAEAYENLSKDEGPVFTDEYTKKFRIRIGVPVSMDRDKCDPNQTNTCSKGLHVAGKSWLKNNYFGGTGLRVLVNPADVVAVPPEDNYGKMRTCAYYPVAVIGYNSKGNINDETISDGFEDNFMEIISYLGEINKNDISNTYNSDIKLIPEINKKNILERLADIKEIIRLKNV